MTVTEVVGTNGAGTNGAGKSEKPKKLPEGLTEGGVLFACDPFFPKIGDYDDGCVLAADDPLKDEHAHYTDAQLGIDELAASMEASGEAILIEGVMRGSSLFVQVGRRSTRAARKLFAKHKAAGTKPKNSFNVLVKGGLSDEQLATGALVKDFNRYEDTGMALARKFARFRKVYGWSSQKLANMTGQSRQSIDNALSLLKLSEPWQKALDAGKIGIASAYEIAKSPPEKQAERYAEIIGGKVDKGEKVRKADVQVAVARAKQKEPKAKPAKAAPAAKTGKVNAKGGKPAKAAPAPKKTEPVAATNVAPTSAEWRKFLAALEDPKCIAPRDPDLVRFRQAVKADPILLVRVAAGEAPLTKIPGLKRCFAWAGIKDR